MRRIFAPCAATAMMVSLSLVSQAWADAPFAPPAPLLDPSTAKPGPHAVVQTFRLDGVRGMLEKTTFADVQKRFGGQVTRQGEAGNALSWLCYDLPGQHLRVWLTSDEIHGHRLIGGVTIGPAASPANSPQCPVIAGNASADVDGIAVGQATTAVRARLGAPGLEKEGWTAYVHTAAQSGGFTEQDSLVFKADGGHIGYLQASRLTSN